MYIVLQLQRIILKKLHNGCYTPFVISALQTHINNHTDKMPHGQIKIKDLTSFD